MIPIYQLIIVTLNLLYVFSIPIIIKINGTNSDIKHRELLPPDHIPGAHLEQDGHINKDYHHEVFLGNLLKDGSLNWDNLDNYKKLIEVFHQVDIDNDHRVTKEELSSWIHDRIQEHYNNAENESNHVFLKVYHEKDNLVSWPEYKAQLFELDPTKYEYDNTTIEEDKNHEYFANYVKHWIAADTDNNLKLDKKEFVSFLHPEHNIKTISLMVDEMLPSYDRNKDGQITLEEFIRLPDGVVDPEEAELDLQYQKERAEEFKNDIDTNGDNIATRDELNIYLDPRHKQHAAREAEYLIRTSDRDRDGRLSEHEMLMNYELFTGSSFSNYAQVLHDEF